MAYPEENTLNKQSRYEKPVNEVLLQEQQLRNADGDLQTEASSLQSDTGGADKVVSIENSTTGGKPFQFIPLGMGGGGRTHVVTKGSRNIIKEEVSLEDLQNMTTKFYEKAFEDVTLDKFIRSHKDPHGERFAKWIHQKLSGSAVWDQDRVTRNLEPVTLARGAKHVVHDRSSAHAAAWYSPKRPIEERGRHFKLEECRVWMRLHFWAMRESGVLEKSPSFGDYYVRFIGHFMRIYESTAPMFARESFRWSSNPDNLKTYINNGRRMNDVLGISFEEAEAQLPEEEANDFVWPYNRAQ